MPGLLITANKIFSVWAKNSPFIFPTFVIPVKPDDYTYLTTIFLLAVFSPAAGLICFSIVQKKSAVLTFIVSVPFLALSLAVTVTPNFIAVLMLLICLIR
jgi:hypothetical protein